MTVKKDPKRQLLGKIAKARGKQFESRIDDSFAYYAQKGFAIIEKTPEPMHPTKNLGNGKFIAYYEKQAQPDYKGTIKGGRTVMFEAKFTAADRMEQSRVLQSQQDYMDRHQALGARCFVIAGFSSGMVYCVPWDIWKTMKDHFGRKYVTEATWRNIKCRRRGMARCFCSTELKGVTTMSEISMYEAQKKKMQGLCDEHDLVYRFEKGRYPIIFTIKPVQGMDAQISMLENVEEVGYRSPDASMSWIFEDGGLDTKVTGGTFTISKTLRTKIESILVKMITYWQQYFFRDVLEKNALRSGLMPVIDEDEAGDTDEEPEDEGDMQGEDGPEVDLDDPDIQQAITIVRAENKATVGLLQRRMSVGYAKAARLIDALEELGVVGPYNGSDGREVLPTDEPDDTEGGED